MTISQEKRKYSRVPFATRIDVTMNIDGENLKLNADSKDLSLRGAFIKTKENIPVGTPCDIVVHLTGSIDDIKMEIKGNVARHNETGVGIAFDTMDLDTYTHLKNIVDYNSKDN